MYATHTCHSPASLRIRCTKTRSNPHLGGKQRELLREDPGAGVEAVLLGEELLHGANSATQVDLSQHLDHTCGAGKGEGGTLMTSHILA